MIAYNNVPHLNTRAWTTIPRQRGILFSRMSRNLNNGRNLTGTGDLKYGGVYQGCINYTSRALFFSGVLNINALLPITAPLLLNLELGIRQIGIYASPFLTTRK